jgi:hypothetical protein
VAPADARFPEQAAEAIAAVRTATLTLNEFATMKTLPK